MGSPQINSKKERKKEIRQLRVKKNKGNADSFISDELKIIHPEKEYEKPPRFIQ